MYTRILVPIDLDHREKLEKAMKTAADLAKHYQASIVYVGVGSSAPSGSAHTPEEYKKAVERFAKSQSDTYGVSATGEAVIVHDPSVELDRAILKAIERNGSDLVVMATHVPGIPDHFYAAHGAKVASRASVSVMLVR
ncbi:universal stress protein [Fulvimarina pelagi]|nr:universal stress protein [Fulvimarina pelagi]BAT31516.1 hypothetical protein [Fulvimarina pelagi]